MPVSGKLQDRWKAWIKGGALCSEMEASTIFVVSSFLKCRAGGIMFAGGTGEDLNILLKTTDFWPEDFDRTGSEKTGITIIPAFVYLVNELIILDRVAVEDPNVRIVWTSNRKKIITIV